MQSRCQLLSKSQWKTQEWLRGSENSSLSNCDILKLNLYVLCINTLRSPNTLDQSCSSIILRYKLLWSWHLILACLIVVGFDLWWHKHSTKLQSVTIPAVCFCGVKQWDSDSVSLQGWGRSDSLWLNSCTTNIKRSQYYSHSHGWSQVSSIFTVEVQNIHSTLNKEAQHTPQKRYTSITMSKAPAKNHGEPCAAQI